MKRRILQWSWVFVLPVWQFVPESNREQEQLVVLGRRKTRYLC